MLPEFDPVYRKERLSVLEATEPLFGPEGVRRDVFERKAALAAHGVPTLELLSFDDSISVVIDLFPMAYAVTTGIPMLEEALVHGSIERFEEAIDTGLKLEQQTTRLEHRWDDYGRLCSISTQYQHNAVYQTLQSNNVLYDVGKDSLLDPSKAPTQLRFLKGFSPYLLTKLWSNQETHNQMQAKLTKTPFVTSVYSGEDSMTYFGVGVSVQPTRIIRSFATDVCSGKTTVGYSPSAEHFDSHPQLVYWDDVVTFSKVCFASMLNVNPTWYSEFWVERADRFESVFVRPYDAWVSHTLRTGYQHIDNRRAIAAIQLSRSLGGVPIEVLE